MDLSELYKYNHSKSKEVEPIYIYGKSVLNINEKLEKKDSTILELLQSYKKKDKDVETISKDI